MAASTGERYRLDKDVEDVPAGTEVEVVDPMVDHLDWFRCMVRLPDGSLRRLPLAIDKYATLLEVL